MKTYITAGGKKLKIDNNICRVRSFCKNLGLGFLEPDDKISVNNEKVKIVGLAPWKKGGEKTLWFKREDDRIFCSYPLRKEDIKIT